MKIKLIQLSVVLYFLLIFIFLKTYNIYSIIFFFAVLILDYFSNIKTGIKNLLYFLSALSVFTPIFGIFLIFLPFMVFGLLLKERSFMRDYIMGFAVSFIPTTIIYLISTYLSIPLSLPVIISIFYALPLIAILLLKKKSLDVFELGYKEFIAVLVILFFTSIVAINIIDDKSLFMANSGREFYRVQNIVQGLDNEGLIPIYDPRIGSGVATFLWTPPAIVTHFAVINLLLKFYNPLLFFNSHTFFILLLTVFSLNVLFYSIIRNRSALNVTGITLVSLVTGLNFFILQSLESIRAFFDVALANLLFSLILNNPKRFKDWLVLGYLAALVLLVHPGIGFAIVVFSASLLLCKKIYYIRERDEIKYFIKWFLKNKLKLFVIFIIFVLLPKFFCTTLQ